MRRAWKSRNNAEALIFPNATQARKKRHARREKREACASRIARVSQYEPLSQEEPAVFHGEVFSL